MRFDLRALGMFKSAALKLTLSYLAIIMALSIGSSLVIYRLSSNDLTRNAHRQIDYFDSLLGSSSPNNYSPVRLRQLDEDLAHLKANLLAFNLFVLIGGGALSYALARRTLEPIEGALESQKRFAADASHELRTPLAAMQTEIEVALRNPKLSKSDAIALLGSNLEEVAKLRNLSDGLLRLASRNGQLDSNQVVDLSAAAASAVERLAKAAEVRKVRIKLTANEIKTRGDVQSLTDLIAIFLDNAIKYSKPRGEIRLSVTRRGKAALVSVADQGQGIAPADLPHIFDRFYRADSSRSKNQADGYGLGLAIAKKITDLHEGHIEVKSTLGKGSAFTIHLPLA